VSYIARYYPRILKLKKRYLNFYIPNSTLILFQKQKRRAWVPAHTGWDQQWEKLSAFVKGLRENPNTSKVYLYGLCWGGKVATLAGCETVEVNGAQVPAFDAIASLHPG
jgi:dienelactone hydrolase